MVIITVHEGRNVNDGEEIMRVAQLRVMLHMLMAVKCKPTTRGIEKQVSDQESMQTDQA